MNDKTLDRILDTCHSMLDGEIMGVINRYSFRLADEVRKEKYDPDIKIGQVIDIVERALRESCDRMFKVIRNNFTHSDRGGETKP